MTVLITSEKEKIPLFDSLEGWWDNLKIQIRRTCIDFSSRKRRQLLSERNSLTKRLLRAKSAVFAGDRGQISTVNKLESALEAVINNECEGAKVRSRARWSEEGEKPTRFFFRLERKHAEKNIFESLFNESGKEKFSHNDIELILVDFYKALFSKDFLNMQIKTQIIDDLDLSLSDLEREQCEGLARYFFGNRFSNLDPSFDFYTRSISFSSEPSAFYRNCLSLLSSLRSKHGSLPADFSCKNLYNLLLDLPSASPRSSSFWAASLKRPMNR